MYFTDAHSGESHRTSAEGVQQVFLPISQAKGQSLSVYVLTLWRADFLNQLFFAQQKATKTKEKRRKC
jgi:hypothetical protein